MSDDSSEGTAGATTSTAAGTAEGARRDRGTGLTERQRTILEVIRASVTSRGYPPSIREIGDAVGPVVEERRHDGGRGHADSDQQPECD